MYLTQAHISPPNVVTQLPIPNKDLSHGKAIKGSLPKMGRFVPGGGAGAAAPRVSPNSPIFGGSTPLDLLSGSMWVLCKDEVT